MNKFRMCSLVVMLYRACAAMSDERSSRRLVCVNVTIHYFDYSFAKSSSLGYVFWENCDPNKLPPSPFREGDALPVKAPDKFSKPIKPSNIY